MNEIPMYSPNIKARLYKMFTESDKLPLNPEELETEEEYDNWKLEVENYRNYDSIKWVFDGEIQFTESQPMPGMRCRGIFCAIRSNTHKDITQGDIIRLTHRLLQGTRYFTVTGTPRQSTIDTPKTIPTFKRIELRSLL